MITVLRHDLSVAGRTIPALRGFIPFSEPQKAWLSLGSNLGDRARYLRRGVDEMSKLSQVRISQISHVYKTTPVGTDGRDFFNLVIEIETQRSPHSLLDKTQMIEHRLGRVRTGRWNARTLDIDILAIENITLHSARLQLPHPFASSRLFVLVPWLELANPRLPCGHTVQAHMESTTFHDKDQLQGLECLGLLDDVDDSVNTPWTPNFDNAQPSDSSNKPTWDL